ncbi:MAG: type IV secretory system conjugative DNA transfer family protein [Sphingomonas sp.]|uniref:type IV secretory system conjugative DNA transfer family protein n=1 Tax=Sphingomonas sp. TaxID=28214 RepID=UPI0025DB1ACB|nr:type IV secretory system conjugative DNA transfer family protein [Sphingomonas sp.]MBQ1499622.1 type IV secretory system conjugative DNA transfer family protein [Sphingomonas sp.]MBQ8106018.1 type IV secretory system conjugative DNA transfer family protein [Afipia sp.]
MNELALPGGGDLWRAPADREFASYQNLARTSGASAHFATTSEILTPRWRYEWGDPTLLLGHHADQRVGLAYDDRHCLTVAGSRGGKGVSLIVPNLILWPGSALVLDPKGELARMTVRARREANGQDVVVLDPFGVSGQPQASCNLLDMIDLDSPRVVADLHLLLESLIQDSASDSHWTAGGRELVMSLVAHAKVHLHRPSLVDVYDLLSGKHGTVLGSMDMPSDVFGAMLCDDQSLNGALKAMAIRWLEIPSREQGSILSTARRQLAWLEGLNNPEAAMTRVSESSTFRLADLKRKNVSLYLCLPASDMHGYRAWLRAFVNMAMAALENTPSRPGAPPVLLLLDEFATLGYMPSLEKAAGLLAGAGVKLWPIVQDLGQLEAIYGKRWGTFIGNAGVTTWHALGGDRMTAEYLSARLGNTQYWEEELPSGDFLTRATTGLLQGGGRWAAHPLLSPDEIERAFARETGRLLALSPGSAPMILDRFDIRHGFLKEWIDD